MQPCITAPMESLFPLERFYHTATYFVEDQIELRMPRQRRLSIFPCACSISELKKVKGRQRAA